MGYFSKFIFTFPPKENTINSSQRPQITAYLTGPQPQPGQTHFIPDIPTTYTLTNSGFSIHGQSVNRMSGYK